MFKSILIFSNLIFSLILNVIFGEGVKVTQETPGNAKPGSEFEVVITINKTDVSGFAKIQQELPAGFVAEAIESQGASFTYNDNKVKLIWMALPESEEFSIKYKVKVGADVQGTHTMTGKFSYLYNNERKVVDLPIKEIVISDEELADSTPTTTETKSEPAPQETPAAPTGSDVVANRTISDLGGGNFQVNISLKHNGVQGFAKVQEKLPESVSMAKGTETKHAVFSFVDNQAKFVWMSLPQENDINISYTVTGSNMEELNAMVGDFAFLKDEETKKIKIYTGQPDQEPLAENKEEEVPVQEEPEEVVENTIIEEPVVEEPEPIEPTPTEPEPVQEEVVEVIPEKKEPVKQPKKTSTIPTPEAGLTFKVQICAGHDNVVVNDYFKSEYHFSEGPIFTENHEGWIKYTVGGYNKYRQARDRRNAVTAGYDLPGPFVTAYNDGTRITVQEALMISNQNWVQ